jgi:hypothetical protein
MVQNDINPNNNLGVQTFSHLETPTQYQNSVGKTILIPTGRFL